MDLAGRYIVTFKPKDQRADTSSDKREILARTVGREQAFTSATELANSEPANGATLAERGYDIDRYAAPILIVRLSESEAEALRADPDVLSVEPDGEIFPITSIADNVDSAQVEGSETIPKGVAAIHAPQAWDATRAAGVKVAVVDSGIDYTHPDLTDNYGGGVSFVESEPDPMDVTGHGTHCAGIVCAAMNGKGVVGVAPSAELYGVKVLSAAGGAWAWLIEAIDWCITLEMRVVSMSVGAPSVPEGMRRVCEAAWEEGLILVAAAGNDLGSAVSYPARLDTVIGVSALNDQGELSMLSNKGPEIELCAPGVQILSTEPGKSYDIRTGTSQATPHVAGAAALATGSHRFSGNVTIRRLLAETADELDGSGRTPEFGYGRVNAARAAGALEPPPPVSGIP